jgi:hypothetical protein
VDDSQLMNNFFLEEQQTGAWWRGRGSTGKLIGAESAERWSDVRQQ